MLCLGITSLLEEQPNYDSFLRTVSHDDLTEEEKTPIHISMQVSKPKTSMDLERYQDLLSPEQKLMVGEVMECLERGTSKRVQVESLVSSKAPKTKRIRKAPGV